MDILSELYKISQLSFDEEEASIFQLNASLRESAEISKMIKKNIQKTDTIYYKLDEISNLNEQLKEHTNQINEMVKGYIRIFDFIWEMHRFSKEQSPEILDYIQSILEKIEVEMKKVGIFIDNPKNQKYQTKLHEIIATQEVIGFGNEIILDVLKVGINFKGEIIRKAQVITNLNKEEI
ncbi:nucleotide exchange factor GrpE [Caloramator proteoclasticus]|uniref:Molecular chaperone GrpE (Heat shock protein) n=1 Tax=Caloramator proteoclasticus DSM 10124 TaxID=1121262 RepID=A0A1M4Z2F8_9CLOT|nr:nucleotide exchange factor GrpE [Caloramator proteoclasticus]SHF12128.1 Molecular chaperone GrpE (heat shock protein) [Caloramator proteoclasticus DSM 10124]